MKHLKNILAFIGLIAVVSTLIFAVQSDGVEEKPETKEVEPQVTDKNVADTYQISAIEIPKDLNFAGEAVPQEDSNALLLMKRANKYFPIIEPILKKNGIPDDFKYLAVAESGLFACWCHRFLADNERYGKRVWS